MTTKPKKVEVGRGSFVTGPVVTSDAVYAGIREDVTVRFDRRTLRKTWQIDSDNLNLGQAIGDELLTVGGPPGRGGVRSAGDGRLLWTAPARFAGVGVWEGRVEVDASAGLELRDAHTGAVLQTYAIPGGYTSWACQSGDLGILQDGRRLKAVDLKSGKIQWDRPVIDEMQERLAERTKFAAIRMSAGSRPDVLIAFHEGSTFALSAVDGSIIWGAGVWSPYAWPTIHEGRVHALCLDRFRALDENTGAMIYDVAHPELRDAFRDKTGTIYHGHLAVANESGHLAIFNAADGRLASLYESTVPLWRTEEVDGRLLVATDHGTLLVFDESIWGS